LSFYPSRVPFFPTQKRFFSVGSQSFGFSDPRSSQTQDREYFPLVRTRPSSCAYVLFLCSPPEKSYFEGFSRTFLGFFLPSSSGCLTIVCAKSCPFMRPFSADVVTSPGVFSPGSWRFLPFRCPRLCRRCEDLPELFQRTFPFVFSLSLPSGFLFCKCTQR